MPLLVMCGACGRTLRVPDELLGKKVKCPACAAVFDAHETPAQQADLPPPPLQPKTSDQAWRLSADEAPLPQAPKRPAADDELTPCPSCGERIRTSLHRCPYCEQSVRRDREREEEDEEDDRPVRRRRSFRRGEPHRGPMVLVFGIISVVFAPFTCCGLPGMLAGAVALGLGIPAWVIGRGDLRKMRDGLMDAEGKGQTQAGMVCGIVGVSIVGAIFLIVMVIVLIYVIIIAATMASGAAGR